MGSQSNLIGIETRPKCINNNASASLNRTLLELKHERSVHRIGLPSCLSIEPYWNWNWKWLRHRWSFPMLSIEPYWNWNAFIVPVRAFRSALSIEPYWNWNILITFSTLTALALNRTLLELKHIQFISSALVQELSIVPYWNWNEKIRLSPGSLPTLNRTLLELKPENVMALTGAATSQSYLIGIETECGWAGCARHGTLNRTLLELKRRASSLPGASDSSQSYLIGIETSWNPC